jgi:phosphoenolpyruvate-protein phosphotransferase
VTARLSGRPAAPGAAIARAFVLDTTSTGSTIPAGRARPVAEEVARLDTALAAAAGQSETLAAQVAGAAGRSEAEIFEVHAEFARDPELRTRAVAGIEAGASAERAVTEAFESFRVLLSASSSEYLAARVQDLDDVRDRVVALLQDRDVTIAFPDATAVIVARELTPSQTASIPRELIAALVTETGSPTSHAAILARSLGIPAVVACDGVLAAVHAAGTDVEVAVDGRLGEVTVDPSVELRASVAERIAEQDRRRRDLTALRGRPGSTADGHRVELATNVGGTDDPALAVEAGAEGAGLVRTELLFQGRTRAPSVDDQAGFYVQVLRAFPGQRVVFRTMDVGGDKPLRFVDRALEANPALGLRGIRLHLARPDLLRDQLRALLRARTDVGPDGGRLAIMFPLVATVGELLAARGALVEVAAEEQVDLDDLEVGVMVEVPSAALGAARLAEHVDFLSIGTNDLLQYLFAADRLNGAVAQMADVCDPDALGLIGAVVAAGHAAGAWVGACGEAASDPVVAAALVGLDVDELSMTHVAIPEVKAMLAGLELATCQAAVRRALAEGTDAASVRALLEDGLGLR